MRLVSKTNERGITEARVKFAPYHLLNLYTNLTNKYLAMLQSNFQLEITYYAIIQNFNSLIYFLFLYQIYKIYRQIIMDKLWVDKHRPKRLQQLNYHHDVSQVLSQLATKDDFPHLLFYGPNGAGKKTRVLSFLSQVYGPTVYKLRNQEKTFKLDNQTTTIQCNVISSNYHLEITPADNQYQDRYIIQKLLKEVASNEVVQTKSNHKSFKVVIINQADRLTKEAQAALRRTMEKYVSACRLILVCERLNRLIAPIRSRCLNIRIAAPKKVEIIDALQAICKKQLVTVNTTVLQGIAELSKGNLRSAILQLQVWRQLKIGSNIESLSPPWKRQISFIVKQILTEQTPGKLKSLRDKFYELLVNCIEGSIILRQLLNQFINSNKVSETVLVEIIHQAAISQQRMFLGSKPIFHLEAFAAHCMLAIKEEIQRKNKK